MPFFFSGKNDDAQEAAATANKKHHDRSSTALREGLMGLHELSRSSLGSGGRYRYNPFFYFWAHIGFAGPNSAPRSK